MKRQLRDFGIEGRPAPQTEEETVQSLYDAYQGKSEAELMRALSGMSAEENAFRCAAGKTVCDPPRAQYVSGGR